MSDLPLLILGGSYAGLLAAARLRRKVPKARILLIADQGHFQQRVRWHEALAGRRVKRAALAPLLARAGVEFLQARISAWDPAARQVEVQTLQGPRIIAYRGLICALGSVSQGSQVPGAEYLWQLSFDQPLAARHAELQQLAARGGRLLVIGNGLTGVECASELAQRFRGLQVSLLGSQEPLRGFCREAREHAERRLRQLQVTLLRGRVRCLQADAAQLEDGRLLSADRLLWCGGLRANPLLLESGLPLTPEGRLRVGADLRVEGYDHLWAAGDCSAATLTDGQLLRLSCATALPSGGHAGEAMGDWLQGRQPQPFAFAYVLRCLSLGRGDGIWQLTDARDRAQSRWLGGWRAALIKWMLCTLVWVAPRWELSLGRAIYHWPRTVLDKESI
ncbi:NAD(P)/FAD-dependent oxidoreductase [Pseudomonas sp. Fl4BN1]|uniref:NAD(P)/FAD-dependent oxidoreductase n=1 Tax=Pseudomonas sp. Fl4BN1 TaxID=2697651 RepID=UPI00137806B0|nr:FAD-dependent oxidoreductase [Pseudomonas sp. Fl4BN1]NBF11475.1 FAD-dependent oxidoreductase [Pseudomonas sp. Fl4BN1]